MTEDEAKTKWCPMVRFNVIGQDTWPNRSDNMKDSSRCLASGCMAWRWDLNAVAAEVLPDGIKHYPRQGFCGLAGKP